MESRILERHHGRAARAPEQRAAQRNAHCRAPLEHELELISGVGVIHLRAAATDGAGHLVACALEDSGHAPREVGLEEQVEPEPRRVHRHV